VEALENFMSNLYPGTTGICTTTTSNNTFTYPGAPGHTTGVNGYICGICGQYYFGGHICSPATQSTCPNCGQYYNSSSLHICSTYTWPNGIASQWVGVSSFKNIKEITTDSELEYYWDISVFNMKLPGKFSDCFLKVGYRWSPLYPLIFSANEGDSDKVSFHVVLDITDKIFEGDKVILKGVTTAKIEDNLTLLQLTERVNQFFKKDK
jgi:hypothetical protein